MESAQFNPRGEQDLLEKVRLGGLLAAGREDLRSALEKRGPGTSPSEGRSGTSGRRCWQSALGKAAGKKQSDPAANLAATLLVATWEIAFLECAQDLRGGRNAPCSTRLLSWAASDRTQKPKPLNGTLRYREIETEGQPKQRLAEIHATSIKRLSKGRGYGRSTRR